MEPCSEKAKIERNTILLERSNKILFGNGTPEDGMLFQFRDFMKDHQTVVNDIAEIKEKLSTITEINNELEITRRVNVELEKKIKIDEEIAVKDEIKKNAKKGLGLQTISVTGGVVIIFLTFIFQLLNYNLNRQTKEITATTDSTVNKTNIMIEGLPMETRGGTYRYAVRRADTTLTDTVK